MKCRSVWHTPQAINLIRTSSGPGRGMSTCLICSGSLNWFRTAACMVSKILKRTHTPGWTWTSQACRVSRMDDIASLDWRKIKSTAKMSGKRWYLAGKCRIIKSFLWLRIRTNLWWKHSQSCADNYRFAKVSSDGHIRMNINPHELWMQSGVFQRTRSDDDDFVDYLPGLSWAVFTERWVSKVRWTVRKHTEVACHVFLLSALNLPL